MGRVDWLDNRKLLFWLLVLLNMLAVLAGIWYYQWQIAETPLPLLFFVPDCPLYVFLSLLVILRAVKSDAFSFIVSCGMVKYGLWTVFALIFHSGAYFSEGMLLVSSLFVIGHIGMALEGLALLPEKKAGAAILLAAIGWFLLNDFADYALGTVPRIPAEGIGMVAALTIAGSLAIPVLLWAYQRKVAKTSPVKWLRKIVESQA